MTSHACVADKRQERKAETALPPTVHMVSWDAVGVLSHAWHSIVGSAAAADVAAAAAAAATAAAATVVNVVVDVDAAPYSPASSDA